MLLGLPLLLAAGFSIGSVGTFDAFMEGNYKLGLFRGILLVAGATAVLRGAPPVEDVAGTTSVYSAVNPQTGETVYVGITDNFEARAAAHLRQKGIMIQRIPELQNLAREDARAVEQALIEYYGLGKNGGTLLNKINSISSRNPIYANAIARGVALAQAAGLIP